MLLERVRNDLQAMMTGDVFTEATAKAFVEALIARNEAFKFLGARYAPVPQAASLRCEQGITYETWSRVFDGAGADFQGFVLQNFAAAIARDLLLLIIEGDTTIVGTDPKSRLLAKLDGLHELSKVGAAGYRIGPGIQRFAWHGHEVRIAPGAVEVCVGGPFCVDLSEESGKIILKLNLSAGLQVLDPKGVSMVLQSPLQRECDAWRELAEALAQTARGRHLGLVNSLGRLRAAKDGLLALGIEPPVEPEFDSEELVAKVALQE